MKRELGAALVAAVIAPTALLAQSDGSLAGTVLDAATGRPIAGAVVALSQRVGGAITDGQGRYEIRGVRPGLYLVTVRAIGYGAVTKDNVAISGGGRVVLDVRMQPDAVQLPGIAVVAQDRLLDPRVTATTQTMTGTELRQLPVTTIEDAVQLQAGVVGNSIRGGRVGQDVLIVDGLGVKNQLDASTGRPGVSIPPIALEEADLVTNGFSALYGQALSGVVNLVTRDGGDRREGRLSYETDRPFPAGWDVGLDRLVASLGGPILGARFFTALDARARLDDDPVNAPPPTDPLDPRSARPWVLPHAAGEQYDALAKLTLPVGDHETVRLLGVRSIDQRLLYDPELKYALDGGTAQRVDGRLGLFQVQHRSSPDSSNQFTVDFRLGYYDKESIRAPLASAAERRVGAFTLSSFDFLGEGIARSRDTAAAQGAIPGFATPGFAVATPWGAPAFFRDASSRGELAWNRFSEWRGRLDAFIGRGANFDLRVGGEYASQRVETFTRLDSYQSVAAGAPGPRVSSFSPTSEAGYAEVQHRNRDLTVTLGLRFDAFTAHAPGDSLPRRSAVSPRFAVTALLDGATVTASFGRFVQPPDFQYLVDAAFDDSLRTGRFRRGNPTLGFESSVQYEFAVRARAWTGIATRVSVFQKRLDGLVASLPIGFNPDSAVFGNGDYGEVKGLEVTFEHEYQSGLGARLTYVLQDARATATDAFNLFRRARIAATGDTIVPAIVTFPLDFDRRHALIAVLRARVPPAAGPILSGFEASVVARWSSGLPYSRTNLTGDSLIGLPNGHRLPSQSGVDLLVRRLVRVGGLELGLYVDVRNLSNARNIDGVRRDTGSPDPGSAQVTAMAEAALKTHPEAIPYESPRYRAFADADGNGIIAGRTELLPLYERAARDFLQPIFAYGPPRLIRIGTEITF